MATVSTMTEPWSRPAARRSATTSDTCWASSPATPPSASARARAATPSGKRSVGRSDSPVRRSGTSSPSDSTATPSVVPTDSTSSCVRDSAGASSTGPLAA